MTAIPDKCIKKLMKNAEERRSGLIVDEYKEKNPVYHDTKKLLKTYRLLIRSIEHNMAMLRDNFSNLYDENIDAFLQRVSVSGLELDTDEGSIKTIVNSIAMKRNRLSVINQAVSDIRSAHEMGSELFWTLYYTYMSPKKMPLKETCQMIGERLGRKVSQSLYYKYLNEAIEVMDMLLWG